MNEKSEHFNISITKLSNGSYLVTAGMDDYGRITGDRAAFDGYVEAEDWAISKLRDTLHKVRE